MSILKGHHHESVQTHPKLPYDDKGRYVSLSCPLAECGAGTLRYESDGMWHCDGLIDPGDDDKPLEACWYFHIDGKPRADGHDGDGG